MIERKPWTRAKYLYIGIPLISAAGNTHGLHPEPARDPLAGPHQRFHPDVHSPAPDRLRDATGCRRALESAASRRGVESEGEDRWIMEPVHAPEAFRRASRGRF